LCNAALARLKAAVVSHSPLSLSEPRLAGDYDVITGRDPDRIAVTSPTVPHLTNTVLTVLSGLRVNSRILLTILNCGGGTTDALRSVPTMNTRCYQTHPARAICRRFEHCLQFDHSRGRINLIVIAASLPVASTLLHREFQQ